MDVDKGPEEVGEEKAEEEEVRTGKETSQAVKTGLRTGLVLQRTSHGDLRLKAVRVYTKSSVRRRDPA